MQVGAVSWCVIPVSFNMKKMTLNASGCSIMVCDSSFFQHEEDDVECKWV